MPTLQFHNKDYPSYIGAVVYGGTPMTSQRGHRQWRGVKLDPHGIYVTRDDYAIHCVDPDGNPIPLYEFGSMCSQIELEYYKIVSLDDVRTVDCIITWGPDESITSDRALVIAQNFIHRYLSGYYCVYYYHGDTQNPHVHIVIGRIRSKNLTDCTHHISPLASIGSWSRKGNLANFSSAFKREARAWVYAQGTTSDETTVPTADISSQSSTKGKHSTAYRIRKAVSNLIHHRKHIIDDVHHYLLDTARYCLDFSDWLFEINQHGYDCIVRGNQILLRTPWHRFRKLERFGLSADLIRKELIRPPYHITSALHRLNNLCKHDPERINTKQRGHHVPQPLIPNTAEPSAQYTAIQKYAKNLVNCAYQANRATTNYYWDKLHNLKVQHSHPIVSNIPGTDSPMRWELDNMPHWQYARYQYQRDLLMQCIQIHKAERSIIDQCWDIIDARQRIAQDLINNIDNGVDADQVSSALNNYNNAVNFLYYYLYSLDNDNFDFDVARRLRAQKATLAFDKHRHALCMARINNTTQNQERPKVPPEKALTKTISAQESPPPTVPAPSKPVPAQAIDKLGQNDNSVSRPALDNLIKAIENRPKPIEQFPRQTSPGKSRSIEDER